MELRDLSEINRDLRKIITDQQAKIIKLEAAVGKIKKAMEGI